MTFIRGGSKFVSCSDIFRTRPRTILNIYRKTAALVDITYSLLIDNSVQQTPYQTKHNDVDVDVLDFNRDLFALYSVKLLSNYNIITYVALDFQVLPLDGVKEIFLAVHDFQLNLECFETIKTCN
uniref:Uncharacterized protein n=1 Tax=Strigamia maritima TaxID=126957 RepID=T1IWH5_STRMM